MPLTSRAIALLSIIGCASPEQPAAAPVPAPEGKLDLPNDGIHQREYDGVGYGAIVGLFQSFGVDVAEVDMSRFEARWPLDDPNTAVIARHGTPILLEGLAYCHTALDVQRSDVARVSVNVHAPTGGLALVTDWFGRHRPDGSVDAYYGDYETVVSIWDPASHAIVQLMHVAPAESLRGHSEPVAVRAGEAIGTLAELPLISDDPAIMQAYRHTHVNIVNAEERTIMDPARWLPYRDQRPPTFLRAYALDADAVAAERVGSGPDIDLAIELFDRDDFDRRNFEVSALEYELRTQDDRVLQRLDRCELEDLFRYYERTENDRIRNVVDFGNARHQIGLSEWGGADVGYPERTFRYVLTQLTHGRDGRCTARRDRDGQLRESAGPLTLRATAWDARGNRADFETVLEREPAHARP